MFLYQNAALDWKRERKDIGRGKKEFGKKKKNCNFIGSFL